MNKKLILWAGVLALVSAPSLSLLAQEGPGDNEEIEITEEGPGGMHSGMGPEMKGGMGGRQITVKSKKIMRGGPGMNQERGGMRGAGFLSEEETLAMIKKTDPVFGKKVEELKAASPAKYKMIIQMSGRMLSMGKMSNEEGFERDAVRVISLEFDTKELSMKYDKASDADKQAIKVTLRAKLGELFDLKTKGQERRVKQMEREIAKLNKNLESRKANKAKIVEQRLEQVTGEGVGW